MNEARCVVRLKERRAKPFFLRHPWVFSGAVGQVEGAPEKGAVVCVTDAKGRFVGNGFYNADSQIMVRLFSWLEDEEVDERFWQERLERAVRLRHQVLCLPEATSAYRLVYSDSDGLPGLIVDRYGDWLVAQFLCAGMAALKDVVLDALVERVNPSGIFGRADEKMAGKEGIALTSGRLRREEPAGPVEIVSNGLRFMVDLGRGQKTGFFLDQRDNRVAAARLLGGRTVLDAFTYTGGFALAAAKFGGAEEVLGIDRSEPAIELARKNAELNEVSNVTFEVAKVENALRDFKVSARKFGAVILDPPKFAVSRTGVARALRAYRDINLLAMQLLAPEGVLVTCSCSGYVSAHDFMQTINSAAVEAGRTVQIIEHRGQSADHPVIAGCPETAYLKCFICRVCLQ